MSERKWIGGYVSDGGVYYVRKTIHGRKWKFSTRLTSLEAARILYNRFEEAVARGEGNTFVEGFREVPPSHVPISDAAKEFLSYSEHVKGNSGKHIYQTASSLDFFVAFLNSKGVAAPGLDMLTVANLDAFIAWRRQGGAGRKAGPHAVALDVNALKTFGAWLKRTDRLPKDPYEEYKIPKRPRGTGRLKLLDLAVWKSKIRPKMGMRWQYAADVLLATGMRYSSLARLKPENIDRDAGVIRLPGSEIKGKVGVTINVTAPVATKALALAQFGRLPATATSMDKRLRRACLRAGVEPFGVHAFRSTMASHMLNAGRPLKEIQERLAHSSAGTTELYLRRIHGNAAPYTGPEET